jgi:phage shock protein A
LPAALDSSWRISRRKRIRCAPRYVSTEARQKIGTQQNAVALERMKSRIVGREARNEAEVELLGEDSLEDRFAALDREEHIETLLRDLKAKQLKPA